MEKGRLYWYIIQKGKNVREKLDELLGEEEERNNEIMKGGDFNLRIRELGNISEERELKDRKSKEERIL